MKNVLYFVGSMLMILLISACSSEGNSSEYEDDNNPLDSTIVYALPNTRSVELTEEQKLFVKKNNDFAFNFYRAVNNVYGGQSTITSPLSATYLMGMINDGAEGITEQEITAMLGFGSGEKKAVNEFCKALIEQAPQTDPSVILQITNLIATDKKVEIMEPFRKDMADYYQAEVTALDFTQPSATDYLNKWCKDKTQGMVSAIVDEVDPTTLFALMNAICFKALWTNKFNKDNTRDEEFITQDGGKLTLPMMYQRVNALYGENDIYSMLCLPYGSWGWNMYILLPHKNNGIDGLINSLSEKTWLQSLNSDNAVVDVKIPKFKTANNLPLMDIVSRLGAPSMFEPEKANLSGISKNTNPLYLTRIQQAAAIEVSEEGTEASAVSIAAGTISSPMDPYKKVDFHCNRPFVYIIQEASSGAIFFIGTFRG
jgi:serpin B